MADSKPANLNGAYYGDAQGVSIPPHQPPKAYHHPGRGHRSCGCCCIIGTLLKLLIAIVVILGIAALVIWLVLRPVAVKFYVEDVSLTQFNLTSTNTLHYDLKLNVSIRNPNKKIGIDYDKLDAMTYYAGERFGWVELPGFYQGHKNTTMLKPAFKGQAVMVLGDFTAGFLDDQKTSGFYSIALKMKPKMRFKIGHLKTTKYSPRVWCYLEVPVSSATGGFSRTKCDVHYF